MASRRGSSSGGPAAPRVSRGRPGIQGVLGLEALACLFPVLRSVTSAWLLDVGQRGGSICSTGIGRPARQGSSSPGEPADKHLRVHHRPVYSQSYFLITVRPRWQETQHLRCSRLLALLPPQSPKNPEGLSLRACPARRGTAEGGVGPLRRPLAGAGGGRFPLSQLPRLGEQASWRGASAPLLC